MFYFSSVSEKGSRPNQVLWDEFNLSMAEMLPAACPGEGHLWEVNIGTRR